jgi:hypothetical protein
MFTFSLEYTFPLIFRSKRGSALGLTKGIFDASHTTAFNSSYLSDRETSCTKLHQSVSLKVAALMGIYVYFAPLIRLAWYLLD